MGLRGQDRQSSLLPAAGCHRDVKRWWNREKKERWSDEANALQEGESHSGSGKIVPRLPLGANAR